MNEKRILNLAVVVSALGYFVDIYDLLLFSIVRISSLKDIGVPEDQLFDVGVTLINTQMTGMLIGGVLWGLLGDKRGRVSVLFGSIALYSVANIANGFVHSVEAYQFWRFFAGLGLAGELGAAITLVSEVMTRETRGYGTAIVAAVGILGAVVAALIGDLLPWRTAYIIGGVMGIALLFMRFRMLESGMYRSLKKSDRPGDIRVLLYSPKKLWRYFCCILVGLPIWYVVGILITFSPELSKELEVDGTIHAGTSVLFAYLGLSIGDFVSGFASQYFKSRKKILYLFIGITAAFVAAYLFSRHLQKEVFYTICCMMGFGTGFWAVFMTMSSEQFGTNIRATVTTTVPNFVRGAVVPLTLAFQSLQSMMSKVESALIVGAVVLLLAFFASSQLEETHGKNLDYIE